jgi:uncharacterized FlaG/YvyC family protein
MNPSSIQPIGSVQQTDTSALNKLTVAQTETSYQNRQPVAHAEKPQPQADVEAGNKNSLENVSIHFRVDDETNNVTIFLVDRQSKKVLRSIPSSELQKMQIGDILKLTI